MTTVFHEWSYGRFIEIQTNLRRNKPHKMNQGSDFLGGSSSNGDNVRDPIQFRKESPPPPSIIKDDYSSRTDTSFLHQ